MKCENKEMLTVEYVKDFIPGGPGIYANSVHGLCLISRQYTEKGGTYLVCACEDWAWRIDFAPPPREMSGFWSFRLEAT